MKPGLLTAVHQDTSHDSQRAIADSRKILLENLPVKEVRKRILSPFFRQPARDSLPGPPDPFL